MEVEESIARQVTDDEVKKLKFQLDELIFERNFLETQQKEIEESVEILVSNIKSDDNRSYYLECELKVTASTSMKSLSLEYFDSEVGRLNKNYHLQFMSNEIYVLQFQDPNIPSPLDFAKRKEKERQSEEQVRLNNEMRIADSNTPIHSSYIGPQIRVTALVFDDDSIVENIDHVEYMMLSEQINGLKDMIANIEVKKKLD